MLQPTNTIIVSNYTDGMRILDIASPAFPVEVAHYDTYPAAIIKETYQGVWSCNTVLPSGLLLASDMNTGLWIMQPDYARAARIRGTIKDCATGQAIINAVCFLIHDSNTLHTPNDITESSATGQYQLGSLAGEYLLRIESDGYFTKSIPLTLTTDANGTTRLIDIDLLPLPSHNAAFSTGASCHNDNSTTSLTVFPNPATTSITIQLLAPNVSRTALAAARIVIRNILGQSIATYPVFDNNIAFGSAMYIALPASMPAALYTVSVEGLDDVVPTVKFVKE